VLPTASARMPVTVVTTSPASLPPTTAASCPSAASTVASTGSFGLGRCAGIPAATNFVVMS
jgi:hypothetical protein